MVMYERLIPFSHSIFDSIFRFQSFTCGLCSAFRSCQEGSFPFIYIIRATYYIWFPSRTHGVNNQPNGCILVMITMLSASCKAISIFKSLFCLQLTCSSCSWLSCPNGVSYPPFPGPTPAGWILEDLAPLSQLVGSRKQVLPINSIHCTLKALDRLRIPTWPVQWKEWWVLPHGPSHCMSPSPVPGWQSGKPRVYRHMQPENHLIWMPSQHMQTTEEQRMKR